MRDMGPRMTRGKLLPLIAPVIAVALIGGGCVRTLAQDAGPPPPPRGTALLKAAMIAGHDAARAAVGEPPLAWDADLGASAQAHADEMARSGEFRHAVQPRGVAPEGENLWAGMRGAFRYEDMVTLWTAERDDFVNEPTPGFSRSGDWHKVGHYTQIVWRQTTRFGCAMASDATTDYVVCRYSPAGNVIGRRAM
ncbi:MAG: serine protease [Sphingomonas sp.]|nr:MAG: serine protease [Sphingomonas sp.]